MTDGISDEELKDIELEVCNAKERCKEAYETLKVLRRLTASYDRIYIRWKLRHERADRKLAEATKLQIVEAEKGGTRNKEELSKEQIEKILQLVKEGKL